ncbi:sigma-54-dependent Fis family transcriptional regulator [Pseudalkalibacillus sp. A8]|uniref:sigma-54-dependent Fis family transcriptional regulator n=1 Tax=Pseudalkalibacillus sp. A8 TaxID=3382641 RepID=UPI0038B4AD0D
MKKVYTYKELYNKWEKFINGGRDLSHLRKEVSESWIRCRKSNVNPFKKPPLLDKDEIRELLNKNRYLIDVVSPFINLISDLTKETNFIFVLADNKGNILDVRGDQSIIENAKKSNFEIGANRSENAGTNAISVAISTRSPIQIAGPEHYNVHFHQWTCSSAPIHDTKGNLLGVLTLSGHYSLKHTHTLGMVVSLVKAIEKELYLKEKIFNKQKSINHSSKNNYTFNDIIGKSKKMQETVQIAKKVAKMDTRVIVEGESGTGKELFVQAIHNASNRKDKPFVAINCGAVPYQLIESELFGFQEGAFTGAKKGGKPGKFELANGGTLFLDEINSMSEDMQVKLLRVLQQNEITRVGDVDPIPINVRVIAASNQSLESLVEKEEFRKDLYYRLGIMVIEVPPLRERLEDIPDLFSALLAKICTRLGVKTYDYNQDIYSYLENYHWPGNIRELENYIERAVVLTQGQRISIEHFPTKVVDHIFQNESIELTTLEKVEKESIRKALDVFNGNITKTSEMLGITRKTLYKKIDMYKLRKNQIS